MKNELRRLSDSCATSSLPAAVIITRPLGPTSRLTLDVNQQVPNANVAMRVTADRPIVVERVTYFARPTGVGATSSSGLTR